MKTPVKVREEYIHVYCRPDVLINTSAYRCRPTVHMISRLSVDISLHVSLYGSDQSFTEKKLSVTWAGAGTGVVGHS